MDPIEALRIRGIGVGKKLVGDAQAGDVRSGKTFSNADGNDKSGTLPVRSLVAQTVTPGVNNITKQAGIYDGDITIEGDPDLVAANIKQGISVFGVIGTLSGKKWASGTATILNDGWSRITVTGLTFTPSIIIMRSRVNLLNGFSLYQASVSTIQFKNATTANPTQVSTSNVSDSQGYINSTGFQLFAGEAAGTQIDWTAIE